MWKFCIWRLQVHWRQETSYCTACMSPVAISEISRPADDLQTLLHLNLLTVPNVGTVENWFLKYQKEGFFYKRDLVDLNDASLSEPNCSYHKKSPNLMGTVPCKVTG